MEGLLPYTDEEIACIYNQYTSTVYRIALMLMKNREEAQDVLQTVFLKLLTVDKPFMSQEHIKAWLIVTTQNTCKNLLKSWWWKKKVDPSHVLEKAYKLDEAEAEIWQTLTKLPEKLRLPLYLHYIEGYKTEEIAEILEVNPATVRTRLWSARKKLKLFLEEDEYEQN